MQDSISKTDSKYWTHDYKESVHLLALLFILNLFFGNVIHADRISWLVSIVSLIQIRVIWEKETLTEELSPLDGSEDKSMAAFLDSLIYSYINPIYSGCSHPWTGGPGVYKKAD